MSTIALHTEPLRDPVLKDLMGALGAALKEFRLFSAHPYEPIQSHTRQYVAWHRNVLGTSRTFARWILPIWSNSTARLITTDIYGKQGSPIEGLGEQPVSRFIRYLLFELGWSENLVVSFLTDALDYPETSARPLMRRMMRKVDKYTTMWELERKNAIAAFEHFVEEN